MSNYSYRADQVQWHERNASHASILHNYMPIIALLVFINSYIPWKCYTYTLCALMLNGIPIKKLFSYYPGFNEEINCFEAVR